MTETEPRAIIIAGPNGAGKTTFAREFLPIEAQCPVFVNADLIAAGLSPFAPEVAAIKAGRIMLAEIDDHVAHRRSFALETTLSGRAYAAKLLHWRALDYHVSLFFLQLPTAEMAIERVRLRVTQGGHNIPDDVVRRRFGAGLTQFEKTYKPIVKAWFLYNNQHHQPVLLAKGVNP
jgi:predicted ABC-type ATPase